MWAQVCFSIIKALDIFPVYPILLNYSYKVQYFSKIFAKNLEVRGLTEMGGL
jgi:hypothetical protein